MMKGLPRNERELASIAPLVVNIVMAGAQHVTGVVVLAQAWYPVNPGHTHRPRRIILHDHPELVALDMIIMVGPKTEVLCLSRINLETALLTVIEGKDMTVKKGLIYLLL